MYYYDYILYIESADALRGLGGFPLTLDERLRDATGKEMRYF